MRSWSGPKRESFGLDFKTQNQVQPVVLTWLLTFLMFSLTCFICVGGLFTVVHG